MQSTGDFIFQYMQRLLNESKRTVTCNNQLIFLALKIFNSLLSWQNFYYNSIK